MSNKKDDFDAKWRERYVKLLILKKDFLQALISKRSKNEDAEQEQHNLELVSYQIELHMIDHAIYYSTNVRDVSNNNSTYGNLDVN